MEMEPATGKVRPQAKETRIMGLEEQEEASL